VTHQRAFSRSRVRGCGARILLQPLLLYKRKIDQAQEPSSFGVALWLENHMTQALNAGSKMNCARQKKIAFQIPKCCVPSSKMFVCEFLKSGTHGLPKSLL
jgi:hypothetical protein